MSLFNIIKDEGLTEEERQARTKSRANKKRILRHLWNFFGSFLAGLTIVYPVVKIIQYRDIRNNEIAKEAQPKQADTSANKSKSILGSIGKEYKSWAIYYEYGLEKKLGVRHTAAEIQQAIPECYRKALRLNLA